ncbi:beta-xylosidase [Dendrothele bispora CBS 962.96]|uniref:Beta-xylosidase n=1 Tax=Dendrothele bispora (strain CBS 962.96) TaxID=1314807 RepID=A0A4S8M7F8_DENBC|nr:beta-xylosidase [Dendrothele bispora CBS 962.96]
MFLFHVSLALLALRLVSAVAVGGKPSVNARADTFNNPVVWEDLADVDLLRVNDTFYYSASTMHFSPGAPILRSYDLVNWEYIGHSVPSLDFGDSKYSLDGGTAYIRGIWASTLRFRPSNGKYYWVGCIDFWHSFIYTADEIDGEWTQASSIGNNCYYDCGLLIDDDDKMYVVYGGGTDISVAQLSDDGLSEVSHQVVYTSDISREGNRLYKRGSNYYIITDDPSAGTEYILKSTSGPFGPYERRTLVAGVGSPINGGGSLAQGAFVDTPAGDWWYMAFSWAYPAGRIPVLSPITWDDDDWPETEFTNNQWASSYPLPLPARPLQSFTGVDNFTSIGPEWEWNHNPDTSSFELNEGLVLRTASVTTDLYAAKNTITHRILGPKASGTILLDISAMTDGDRAGISMFRQISAYIGVKQTGNTRQLVMVNGLDMISSSGGTSDWVTSSEGSEVATAALSGTQVWLRVTADIAPAAIGTTSATFSYSTDGNNFTNLGNTLSMSTDWEFFMGYRFGIFNFATSKLGGSVTVKSFVHASA